jgi:hypothetical protein
VIADFLDQVEAVFQLGNVAGRVGEDDFLELLEGFRIADQAGKRRNAGPGRKHVEALAGRQCVEHQRAGRLLAHQHLIAGLDPL